MKSLSEFHETLEVVTNGVHELYENAKDAQRVANKEVKKKECKFAFYIQSVVDAVNFDQIFHAETAEEAWDIIFKYYEGGEKFKVVKLQTYGRKYELLQMEEEETIAGYGRCKILSIS